jgi:hypothetical protein
MGTVRIRRTPAAVVPPASPAPAASPPPRMTAEAARRVLESVIIAIITSTGLYLVGSVYSEAYYGRMSIEVSALDLTPPYVALQAVHVVRSLLEYPVTLLGLYFLSRFVITRLPRVRTWAVSLLGRFGRLALLIANGLIVLPLVLAAVNATLDPALVQTNSPLSEVASLMALGGTVLVLYVLWLSVGPRQLLLSELQHRKLVPIVLLFTLYLLDALVATAHNATVDADLFMTGASDSSMAAVFTMASGVQPLPSTDVLLVTIRNGHYFVVTRQPDPPSRTPFAYAIPVRAVDAVQMERVNPAAPGPEGILIEFFPTPTASPGP